MFGVVYSCNMYVFIGSIWLTLCYYSIKRLLLSIRMYSLIWVNTITELQIINSTGHSRECGCWVTEQSLLHISVMVSIIHVCIFRFEKIFLPVSFM